MSTISSISSASNWSTMQGMRRPSDGGKKMAEELFSQLDSSGQGYIDKTTLQSALQQTSSATNVDDLFSQLDSNSDGKITEDEFITTFQDLASQLESQFQANAANQKGGMNGMPPPPPPQDDAGFTKDELNSQLDAIGSSDSKSAALVSNIIENFEAADTNEDGKVSFQEAMVYDQTQNNSTASTTTSGNSIASDESKIMQQLMQLMQAYGLNGDSGNNSTLSVLA